jgi:hypothetical protein
MKIYLIICAVMLAWTYIKIYGEILAFKKKYPNAVMAKTNWAQNLANFTKTTITFLIPVVNVLVFFGVLFFVTDEQIEDIIKSKCVSF